MIIKSLIKKISKKILIKKQKFLIKKKFWIKKKISDQNGFV